MTEIVLAPPNDRYDKPTCDSLKSTGVDCSICCERKNNIKWINCVMGGLQNIPTGKWKDCCEDKPICVDCRHRCRDRCPFCSNSGAANHTLHDWKKGGGPKRKKPFAEAEIIRKKKLAEKNRVARLKMYIPPMTLVRKYAYIILN